MILERLELERVRRFTPRFSCTFAPGLNAVVGPNESGKSTLFTALEAALFWDPTSTREEVRSLYAWGAERPFTLRLSFRAGQLRYRLWKDFHTKELLLEEEPTGTVWRDVKSARRHIGELLGLASQELFAASAAVAQGRLALPESRRDRKALEEALAEAMTGGGDGGSAERALELLARDIQRLTVGLKDKAFKTPGPIKAAEGRLAHLEERYREVARAHSQRLEHQRALQAAEGELVEVVEALELKQSLLAVEAERRELQASLEEHAGRYAEIDGRHQAVGDAMRRIRSLEEAIEGLGAAADLEPEAVQALRLALERRGVLGAALQETQATAQATTVPRGWVPWAVGAGGLALPLLASLGGLWPGMKVAAMVLGFGALVVAGWLWYRYQVARRVRADRQAEAARRAGEFAEVEARIGELADRAGGASPDAVLRQAEEAARLRAERDRLVSERDVRIEDRPIEALEADRSELRRTMATLEERLGQQRFAGPALDAERFAEVRKDVETLEARREELAQRIAHLRGVLEGSGEEAEELAALAEALEAAGRDLHRHRRGLQVRQLAKAVLAEARQAAIAPAVEVFERIVGRYVSEVSAGRYRTVRLGRSVVDLAVLGPEREEFVTSGELSYGTAEQLLLAARLTLAELLAGEKRPPLLLDEPFGAFDEGRLRATMELLSAIAEQRQVILFTHQEAVAEACDHVVVLPPPVGGAPRPEAEKTF